jgi:hypothetical protein
VKKYLTLLIALLSLSFWLVPIGLCAGEPQIKLEQVLQTTHRGFTTDETVELIVFYAGQVGLPLTIKEE